MHDAGWAKAARVAGLAEEWRGGELGRLQRAEPRPPLAPVWPPRDTGPLLPVGQPLASELVESPEMREIQRLQRENARLRERATPASETAAHGADAALGGAWRTESGGPTGWELLAGLEGSGREARGKLTRADKAEIHSRMRRGEFLSDASVAVPAAQLQQLLLQQEQQQRPRSLGAIAAVRQGRSPPPPQGHPLPSPLSRTQARPGRRRWGRRRLRQHSVRAVNRSSHSWRTAAGRAPRRGSGGQAGHRSGCSAGLRPGLSAVGGCQRRRSAC